jgi:hypothetical protein
MAVRGAHRAVPLGLLVLLGCLGCGTTREKLATEQLLLSDAVDRAVAHIDFSPLRGEKVYLDTQYVKQLPSSPNSFVNADYIVSSLRQQMVQAGCLLQESQEDAEFIAEARVGALGTDGHDVNYGVPPNQTLNAAANIVAGGVALPTLPEISLARRQDDTAAAKIAVFAYRRESKEPAWQSGSSVAHSRARGRWILGAGPIQSGTIYKGTQFAGNRLRGNKPKEIPDHEQAYLSPAVHDPRLRGKLRPDLQYPGHSTVPSIASRPEPPPAPGPPASEAAEEPASEEAESAPPAAETPPE